jgi:hypothetical protein
MMLDWLCNTQGNIFVIGDKQTVSGAVFVTTDGKNQIVVFCDKISYRQSNFV